MLESAANVPVLHPNESINSVKYQNKWLIKIIWS